MSDADTIREFVETAVRPHGPWQADVLAALDALIAERDEARKEAHMQRDNARASMRCAEAAEARVAALEEALFGARFFIHTVTLTDDTDPTGEGREIANEILAECAGLLGPYALGQVAATQIALRDRRALDATKEEA